MEHTIPDGRIRMILEQFGGLPLSLASDSQSARFKQLTDQVITVNEATTSADASDVSLPVSGVGTGLQPDHPAYVIFTSGSTGKPLDEAILQHWHCYL